MSKHHRKQSGNLDKLQALQDSKITPQLQQTIWEAKHELYLACLHALLQDIAGTRTPFPSHRAGNNSYYTLDRLTEKVGKKRQFIVGILEEPRNYATISLLDFCLCFGLSPEHCSHILNPIYQFLYHDILPQDAKQEYSVAKLLTNPLFTGHKHLQQCLAHYTHALTIICAYNSEPTQ